MAEPNKKLRTFDGRVFTYDKDHKPVYETPGSGIGQPAFQSELSRLGDPAIDPQDAAAERVQPTLSSLPGRIITSALPMATASLGGAAGAAGGAALAGGTGGWGSVAIPSATIAGETAGWIPGAYVANKLRELSPAIFGPPEPDGIDLNKTTQQGAVNALFSAGGRGITKVLKPGKNAVQDAYALDDVISQAERDGVPLSAGDVTGSSIAQKISKPAAMIEQQRQYIQDQAEQMLQGDIVSHNDAATLLQSGLKKGKENLDKTIGNRIVSLGRMAESNEVKVPGVPIKSKTLSNKGKVLFSPGPESTVTGPIDLSQSAHRAAAMLDQSGLSSPDKTLFQGYLKANPEVSTKLTQLEKAFVKNAEGNKVISPASFENVNALYKQLNEDIVSGKYGDITALKQMRDTLGNDIRASMGKWKNGPQAQQEWDNLLADSVNRNKVYEQHKTIDAALKTADVKNGLADFGLKNVENMKSVIGASADPIRAKEAYRGAFLSTALDKNAGGDVTKLWDLLNQRSNNAVAKELFKPDELFRIKQLGKLAERFEGGNKGTDYLSYKAGTFALGGTAGAIYGSGDAETRLEHGLTAGALLLTGSQMAQMAARNPTVIKALMGLQNASSREAAAKWTRNLYEAARIAGTVTVMMPDGSQVPARIDKNGKPVAIAAAAK